MRQVRCSKSARRALERGRNVRARVSDLNTRTEPRREARARPKAIAGPSAKAGGAAIRNCVTVSKSSPRRPNRASESEADGEGEPAIGGGCDTDIGDNEQHRIQGRIYCQSRPRTRGRNRPPPARQQSAATSNTEFRGQSVPTVGGGRETETGRDERAETAARPMPGACREDRDHRGG
jgi:hypothetical protein